MIHDLTTQNGRNKYVDAMSTKKFYLQPVDGRKSFNNKCHVIKDGDTSVLTSYLTDVVTYNHKTNKMTVKGYFSATTGRHINAFLDFYNFATCSKRELLCISKRYFI